MINRRMLRQALPFLSLAIVLAATFYVQPRTMSYFGLNLMLQYAVPIALATIAQMFIITVNDLDLSIGPFVGLVSCIGATLLLDNPVAGLLALAALVIVYGAVGALIHLRNLPSIVVTLGLSFVWLGIAVMILPSPGGKAPDWLKAIMASADAVGAVSDRGGRRHRRRRPSGADAFVLWRHRARRRRKSEGADPCRLVDAADKDDDVHAGRPLRRASRGSRFSA